MRASVLFQKFVDSRAALHPTWPRCSSRTYSRYAYSSRLAKRAQRRPLCHDELLKQDTRIFQPTGRLNAAPLRILILLLLLAAGVGLASAGQDESPPPVRDDDFRIGVAVDQVFLSVNARSVGGGFVTDLRKEDFEIFEDGIPQEIVNFTSEKVPVHVALLIDASGSIRHSLSEIRRAALGFASSLSAEDRIAVITFNFDPRLILNWTNDLDRTKLALDSIFPRGRTVMNDAIYVAFDDLLRNVEGKKAVILLTDGVDTGSSVEFDEARELALRSEAMVYVVSKLDEYWKDAIAYRQMLTSRGQLIPRELRDDHIMNVRRSLQQLADLTGGKILEAHKYEKLDDVYVQVAEELKNQYYLSYIPRTHRTEPGWRSIEVRLKGRPDAVVSTRQGYYREDSGGT
ncbi:MAG TPA: VWA domain-containing protein [Acidobacteriota bacterium]|nr:VWA domain-containing protein [Acidobacteriota bacterium]